MYTTARSATRNGNSGGQAQAGSQPIPSREGMGSLDSHTSEMGTGSAGTPRTLVGNASSQNRGVVRGGQAHLPCFAGLRIAGDFAKKAPVAQTARPVDDQPHRIGGLSFAHRRAIVFRPAPADIERRNAAMRHAAAAASAAMREEHEWRELADLAAQPEWDRALPYGSVETACALD